MGKVGFALIFTGFRNLLLLHRDLALLKANLIVPQLNLALGDEIGQSAKADCYRPSDNGNHHAKGVAWLHLPDGIPHRSPQPEPFSVRRSKIATADAIPQ
jgi:hypothetical protein